MKMIAIESIAKRFNILKRKFIRKWATYEQLASARRIKIIGFLATSVILTFFASGYSISSLQDNISNDVVRSDLIAPEDFIFVDQVSTTTRRKEAANQVPPVFEYDASLREHTQARIATAFEEARLTYLNRFQSRFGNSHLNDSILNSQKYNAFVNSLTNEKPSLFSLSTNTQAIELLIRSNFSREIEKELLQLTILTLKDFIYSDTDSPRAQSRRLMYQDSITLNQHEISGHTIIPQSVAQARMKEVVDSLNSIPIKQKELIYELLKELIQPNLRYSPLLTESAREAAAQSIPEISTAYRRNQIIARAGDAVTPHVQAVVNYLSSKDHTQNPLRRFLGLFAVVTIILFALYKFTLHVRDDLKLTPERAFTLICITLIAQTIFIWIGVHVSNRFMVSTGPMGELSPYEFAIPYAATTLIVALLLDENLALLCTLIVGLLAGLMTGGSLEMCVYAILSGCAATYGVGQYRHRNVVTRAGILVGVINILAATAVICIGSINAITFKNYLILLLCGVIGGLITAAYASFVVPISESLFDILTDVKLLELSNADLPLLRELAMRAPGTQQHSVMVSSLAQAAAEAIGANALLVRIGCYYHDIGKLLAPEMFVENQTNGQNIHNKIKPRRSASVIMGHVKKGIILGREARLPKQIIDLIPQHHGTRRLHYFYSKALELAEGTGEIIDEADYRYPGPKPQTKEAAVVMLADSAEAAARSLDESTPENIAKIVRNIVHDIISDEQLSECNLTMREITIVNETLVKTLCNIYHHRIVYPGFNNCLADSEEIGIFSISAPQLPVFSDSTKDIPSPVHISSFQSKITPLPNKVSRVN